jgi:hypothetical protein
MWRKGRFRRFIRGNLPIFRLPCPMRLWPGMDGSGGSKGEERWCICDQKLQYLLERVPLTCDLDALLKRWWWFAEGSVGCIGILKDWLVDVVTATLTPGGTSLTEEVLTRTMPHPAKRVSLEMEARAGEHKVAIHNCESVKQSKALLKKPGKAANGKTDPPQGSMSDPPHAVQTEQEAEPVEISLAPQTHDHYPKSGVALGEARNSLETFRLISAVQPVPASLKKQIWGYSLASAHIRFRPSDLMGSRPRWASNWQNLDRSRVQITSHPPHFGDR